MKVCRISVNNKAELARELDKIGANPASLPFFENKSGSYVLLTDYLPCAAANILKQEMLSAGGDAAVHAHAIDCGATASRALLFGSRKQLLEVSAKLKQMPWWNFPQFADEIMLCTAEINAVKTKLMGIINITDDSFFTESRTTVAAAAERALQLVAEGADILDIGAESTRPGAERISEEIETKKISEVVRSVRTELPEVKISVDTTRFLTAKAALENGADIINDVSGLADEKLAEICAEYNAEYILTHSRGDSSTMDKLCDYDNIMLDICNFFEQKIKCAEAAGLKCEKIILDPGFGYAKTAQQNLYLLKNLCAFRRFGLPLLTGVSRKRFLGENLPPEERLEATLAAVAVCAGWNVEYIRVHDVAANRRVIDFCEALKNA